jgi:AcrR family transcriptional regulator
MATRKYEKKKRAENQEETRQRIVEATVALHQTVGGQAATISAIAQKAGVERLTVYRHFPDDRSLLMACTSHYLSLNQPPDPGRWAIINEPDVRLRTALTEIYAYHLQTEAMMNSAYRDIDLIPHLKDLLQPLFGYWNSVADILSERFPASEAQRSRIRALVAVAVHFLTWRTLVREQGMEISTAVEVMTDAIICLASECAMSAD